jgi:hypothetical protein
MTQRKPQKTPSPPQDDRDRSRRGLTFFLADSVGFRLGLATYDVPSTRTRELFLAVTAAAKDKIQLTVLNLADHSLDVNLLQQLEAHLQTISTEPGCQRAIAVTGIEAVMEAGSRLDPPDRFAILHRTNLQRDAFVSRVPVPVVLWINRPSLSALAHEAPDFWHWRTGSFEFFSNGEDLESVLATTVAPALARFLMCHYLQLPAIPFGGLSELAAHSVQSPFLLREAVREFESLGEKIAARLTSVFVAEALDESGRNEVARILGHTLNQPVQFPNQTGHDLNPTQLADQFRRVALPEQAPFSSEQQRMFDRALDQVVRYLVNLASALPKFQSAVAKESLERLSRIGNDLDQTLNAVEWIERIVVADSRHSATRYEADYRQGVIRNLDYLELFGADIPPEASRHALSVAYVSLNLQDEDLQDEKTANFVGVSLPVERVLEQLSPVSGRLLIRGEAGSGKSTLFRWIAIQAAYGGVISQSGGGLYVLKQPGIPATEETRYPHALHRQILEKHWSLRIPFLIRLREFTEGTFPEPQQFPEQVVRQIGPPLDEGIVEILKEGRAIILLDGIDEIPSSHRAAMKTWLTSFTVLYPRNDYLVSTRPQAVGLGWLADLGFREATVNPMSNEDQSQLIDKWHQAVGEELKRRGDHDPRLAGMAERLKAKLHEHPSINRLARYPLLASMICAFHRRNHEHLPPSEIELTERLCFMLLDDRDRLSGLWDESSPTPYSKLEYRHKKLIVQDLAYDMMVHRQTSSLTRDEALKMVEDRLARLGKSADPELIMTGLIERSGMLREPSPGRVDFLHNTFKEYLTSLRLVAEQNENLLVSHWNDAEWSPVILFAAATEKQGFATNLIRQIMTVGSDDLSLAPEYDSVRFSELPQHLQNSSVTLNEARQRQLLTLRCRSVALDLDPELQTQLDKLQQHLFPPRDSAEAEALATAGNLAVEWLKYRPNDAYKKRAASVLALRLIDTPLARQVIQDYLPDQNAFVILELAKVVDALAIPAVVDSLVTPWMEEDFGSFPPRVWAHRVVTTIDHLVATKSITLLDLSYTRVNNLSTLFRFPQLKHLNISHTKITDISPLQHLRNLEILDLSDTPVDNLVPISELQKLKALFLSPSDAIQRVPSIESLQFIGLISGPYFFPGSCIFLTKKRDFFAPLFSCIPLPHLKKVWLRFWLRWGGTGDNRAFEFRDEINEFHRLREQQNLPQVEIVFDFQINRRFFGLEYGESSTGAITLQDRK